MPEPDRKSSGQFETSALDTPLADLPLPTRLRHWVERKNMLTARELVLIAPLSLLDKDAPGRKTIADAKLVLQDCFGMSWEQARTQLLGESLVESNDTGVLCGGFRRSPLFPARTLHWSSVGTLLATTHPFASTTETPLEPRPVLMLTVSTATADVEIA